MYKKVASMLDKLAKKKEVGGFYDEGGGVEDDMRLEVAEHPVQAVAKMAGQFTHRTPRPLAIMPRKISTVPPRNENEGAIMVRLASTCSRSL